jgi:hypothetical protein
VSNSAFFFAKEAREFGLPLDDHEDGPWRLVAHDPQVSVSYHVPAVIWDLARGNFRFLLFERAEPRDNARDLRKLCNLLDLPEPV